VPSWPGCTVSDTSPRAEMFKLGKLKNHAICCDIISMDSISTGNGATPDRLQNIHKKGLNVLYANGAVKWIKRDVIEDQIQKSITQLPSFTVGGNIARMQDQMWNNLDAETQLYKGAP
jgi:hypothetical protein